MKRTVPAGVAVFFPLVATILLLLVGCREDKGILPYEGDEQPGQPVTYFPLSVDYEARYRVLNEVGDSVGTTRFAVISTFDAQGFSGYIAIDSTSQWIATLWIFTHGDTVFSLTPGWPFHERQPIVRNHDQTDLSRHLLSVGDPGSPYRYSIFFHQLPETETIELSWGEIYPDCGRTQRIAVYEHSGDTVSLGFEYFAPDVGRVRSTFREHVESEESVRELMR